LMLLAGKIFPQVVSDPDSQENLFRTRRIFFRYTSVSFLCQPRIKTKKVKIETKVRVRVGKDTTYTGLGDEARFV
jgi:hypothetical protein